MEKINKNLERVFNKCVILLGRGYSIQYCLSKFKKYQDVLEDYLTAVGKIKDLEKVKPGNDYIKSTLDKIYSLSEEETGDNAREGCLTEIKNSIQNRIRIRSLVFKPAMVFLLVFIFASFSFVGLAFGSQSSIPTETLYPVKRTVEKIELIFNPGINEGQLHFQFLESRLYEADKLMDSDFSKNTDIISDLLLEIEGEYEECEQYDYFGDKSSEEVLNSINGILNKYKDKSGREFQNNNDKSDQDEKSDNGMDDNLGYYTNSTNEDGNNAQESDDPNSGNDIESDDPNSESAAESNKSGSDNETESDKSGSDNETESDKSGSDNETESDKSGSDNETESDKSNSDNHSEEDSSSTYNGSESDK
jgi:hypothetical protein